MTRLALISAMLMTAAMPTVAMAQTAPTVAVDGPIVSFAITENVYAEPDMATVGTGVQTQAFTAKQAMADNAAQMDRLIGAITKAGIDRKDIQTSGINLNPQYDYNQQKDGQGPRFIGYQASNQLTVKIRKIQAAGDLIDRMVQAGATNINGPTFGFADDSALTQQARQKAVATAKARADFYANAMGYHSARLFSLSENGDAPRPVPFPVFARAAVADSVAKTEVAPGQLSTSVTLNFRYVLVK